MLGSGSTTQTSVGKAFVHYDVIEIGDQIIQKVRTARSLGDFIARGLGQQTTLYLVGPMIVGVKLADGKVYYWKRSALVVVFCLVLVPVWGLGLLCALFLKSDLEHVLSVQPKLKALGGIPLTS